MQARLIDMRKVESDIAPTVIDDQLAAMSQQLQKDFQYNPAHAGYVVFSYIDYDNLIKTIVLEVLRT